MSDTSEFCVEVVRIRSVVPHPNADRLDLVEFDRKDGPAAYVVVDARGKRKSGDLAVYVSVDAIVPLTGPESGRWEFLKGRLDAKDKPAYRIRAARLRGVYSEGILADLHGYPGDDPNSRNALPPVGYDLSVPWQIGYHNPGPKEEPGLVSLSKGRQRVGARAARIRAMMPEYGLISLRKAPFLFQPGEPVSITEKIHGTNFRFGWLRVGRRWEWVVGSRTVIKTDHRGLLQRAWDWVRGRSLKPGWYGEDVWMAAAEKHGLREKCWDVRGTVFFGEVFGRTPGGGKIQDLTYGDETLGFRLFDAVDLAGQPNMGTNPDSWWLRDELAAWAADVGLEVVPELHRGGYDPEVVKELAEGATTLIQYGQRTPAGFKAAGHVREGVVVEALTGERRKGKFVGAGYRLRKEEA